MVVPWYAGDDVRIQQVGLATRNFSTGISTKCDKIRGIRSSIPRIVALIFGAALVATTGGAALAQGASPDDTARFLAGMQPSASSPLTALARSQAWQRHAKWFDSNWAALEKQRLSRVRAWSERHLKDRQYTLYYMFSGPDFLYADAFFPSATTY